MLLWLTRPLADSFSQGTSKFTVNLDATLIPVSINNGKIELEYLGAQKRKPGGASRQPPQ